MFDGQKFQAIANRWGDGGSRHTAEGHWKEVKIKMEAASQVDAIHKVYALQVSLWLRGNSPPPPASAGAQETEPKR